MQKEFDFEKLRQVMSDIEIAHQRNLQTLRYDRFTGLIEYGIIATSTTLL